MKKLFIIYASLSGLTAVYHLVGIFINVNEASPARHLVFFFISVLMAYWMLKRPRFLPYLFAILLIQQLYSHGKDIYPIWVQERRITWIDVGVVLVMPCIFISILLDARARNRFPKPDDTKLQA